MDSPPSCPFQCLAERGSSTDTLQYTFVPDAVKKHAAFWLQNPDTNDSKMTIMGADVTLVIESSEGPFVLGGFQLESNSKMIQVYLQKEAGTAKEYLTTCRAVGTPCKAICAIPGGPRRVTRLYLELKSLQNEENEEVCFRIDRLKLTARIPDPIPATTTGPIPEPQHPGQQPTQPGFMGAAIHGIPTPHSHAQSAPASLSQEEISSAMAAVSMMMRATENRIVQSVNHQRQQQQSRHEQQMDQLTRLVVEQRLCLQQQTQLLATQSRWMQQQAEEMTKLRQGQDEILRVLQQPPVSTVPLVVDDESSVVGDHDKNAEPEEDSNEECIGTLTLDPLLEATTDDLAALSLLAKRIDGTVEPVQDAVECAGCDPVNESDLLDAADCIDADEAINGSPSSGDKVELEAYS